MNMRAKFLLEQLLLMITRAPVESQENIEHMKKRLLIELRKY